MKNAETALIADGRCPKMFSCDRYVVHTVWCTCRSTKRLPSRQETGFQESTIPQAKDAGRQDHNSWRFYAIP